MSLGCDERAGSEEEKGGELRPHRSAGREEGEGSVEKRHASRREAAAKTRIVDGMKVSMSPRQLECSRKRILVARLLPISPQK